MFFFKCSKILVMLIKTSHFVLQQNLKNIPIFSYISHLYIKTTCLNNTCTVAKIEGMFSVMNFTCVSLDDCLPQSYCPDITVSVDIS